MVNTRKDTDRALGRMLSNGALTALPAHVLAEIALERMTRKEKHAS